MNLQNTNIANVTAPTRAGHGGRSAEAEGEAAQNDITIPQQWGNEQATIEGTGDGDGRRGLHQHE